MIRRGNRWMLILGKRHFKKIPAEVSKKLDFGHWMMTHMLKKFSGGDATLLRFLHRRAAGNMQLLTGGDAGRIRMSD